MMRLLVLTAILASALPVAAQPSVRLRAGLNAASLPVFDGTEARIAPATSVQLDVPVGRGVSFRPEAFYSSEGATTPSYGYTVFDPATGQTTREQVRTGAVTAEQLGLAALVAYTSPVGRFEVGAYGGPALAAKVRERDVFRDEDFLQSDASGLVGRSALSAVGGLTAARGRLGVDLRYALGVSAVTEAQDQPDRLQTRAARSRVATLALTYRPGMRALARPEARTVRLGVRAGANVAGFVPKMFFYGRARVAPAVSVFAEVPVSGRVSLRPEAFYSSEGEGIAANSFSYADDGGTPQTVTFEASALQAEHLGLGAFAAYTVPVRGLSVGTYAGPAVSAKVRERNAQSYQGAASEQASDYFNVLAVTGVGGVSVSRGAVGLDVRYARSATGATNRDFIVGGSVTRSQVVTVALAYRFVR